jgi:hypothetical protein
MARTNHGDRDARRTARAELARAEAIDAANAEDMARYLEAREARHTAELERARARGWAERPDLMADIGDYGYDGWE